MGDRRSSSRMALPVINADGGTQKVYSPVLVVLVVNKAKKKVPPRRRLMKKTDSTNHRYRTYSNLFPHRFLVPFRFSLKSLKSMNTTSMKNYFAENCNQVQESESFSTLKLSYHNAERFFVYHPFIFGPHYL